MKRLATQNHPIRLRALVSPVVIFFNVGADQLWVWCLAADHVLRRQRTRMALEDLTDKQLQDVGLTRAEAEKEYKKWFWQV